MYGSTEQDWQQKAESASDGIRDAAAQAGNSDIANAAHQTSRTLEDTAAQEPVNSTMRTVLLGLAGVSMLTAIALHLSDKKSNSVFVGQWVPTLLIIALWNQIVKGQRGQAND
ncbi:MAG: hypothetical protein M3T49_10640 [Candidatus Eremiobacteraeota bacterium]|nr:hypothetical protein [Candidatus Eremiobacteraeota bacterium]